MKKIGLVSLGCAKNRVDSENILGLLDHNGYQITDNPKEADIIIVNTCGFIESSKRESINTIFDMLSYGKKVIVTGCLAQRYEEELKKEIPEVDFIPIHDYYRFNDLLRKTDPTFQGCGGLDDNYRILSTEPFTAYLKIGEGCDNRCTYCAIPLIRGSFVSRPMDEIIKEAKKLASNGVKEIIVLEQDTTKYGIDLHNGENIASLLKELLKIKELEYIRLLYLYPDEISDELIDLIAKEHERLTPYFDIPIQHSEDHILKDMHRRGDKALLRNLFTKIRNKVPNAILRTTVMVGFPGETNEDVNNLKSFIEEIGFDHLGAFTYSKEEGTVSYNFKHQVSKKEKEKRLDLIMKTQQSISYKRNKVHIGETMEGLAIGKENGQYLLRSYWNAPDDVDGKIYFTSEEKLHNGDKVKVQIDNAFVYDLSGHLVK